MAVGYVSSVATAPSQTDKPKVTNDRSYMLDGEIMLLVLVMLFALLFSCPLFCLYLRRRRRVRRDDADAVEQGEVVSKEQGRVGSAMYNSP